MLDFKEKLRQFVDKTDEDVLKYLFHYWGIEYLGHPFKLIVGGYEKSVKPDKNGNEFGFFQEVRSIKGDILYYPFRLGLVSLFTMHKPNISSSDYWLVDVRLNNKATRDKLSNPFALSLANNVFGKPKNTFLELVDKEKFIRDIFNKRGATADDAGLISRAIGKLAGDMYTDLSERFVFELLQNADDMPKDNNGVNVKLHLLENNILFIHNGLPFSKEDIKAITDIGNSTKKKNPSQTGYKGIGFKIVFQESENVLIKSGGFSFSFDKNHPYYDSLKKNVYAGLNNDEIPWQLKPIWTEQYRYDKEIQENTEFMNNTDDVAIAINTDRVNQFRTDIISLIQEPRFILFLRNIKSIKIDGIVNPIEITKTKSGKAISLTSNNEHLSDWLAFDDFEIKISDEVKEAIATDKAVPPKLKEISSTKLNFICQLVDGKIIPVSPEASFLFTYLPTNVNDYKFPFLVNADFLTTANRQSIHVKNKWNLFLFEEIGKNCLKWIAEVANSSYKGSAYNLLPNSKNSVNDLPWESFYKGYTQALDETDFILSESGQLVKLKDVCIDNTGFTKYIDSSTFKYLFNLQGELLSNEIFDAEPIVNAIVEFGRGKSINISDLIQSVSGEAFKNWLLEPANNIIFLKYLSDNSLLELFASKELFLSEDLRLLKSNDIFSNLGSDHNELIWLDFKRLLHSTVSSSVSEISLPLKKYEPISFINEIICREKKVEIISGLNDGSISFDDFYSYLSKYSSNPLFPASDIKSFPIKTLQARLPNWSDSIYFNTNSLTKLLSDKALPDGLFHLIDDAWNNNSNLKLLGEKLGVQTYSNTEPYSFINVRIADNNLSISSFYLSGKSNGINSNASLWSFILSAFKYLSDPQKESISAIIKKLPVLSKKGVFREILTLYLPSEFTDNDALESLSLQFPNSNIDFVSADYLKYASIDKTEIRTLFKKCDAKTDTKDFLQHTLIPNLNQISNDFLVPLARLLYENRDSEPIINAVLKNTNFKLKTKEGLYKPINECFLGSPYIDAMQIPNPLLYVPIVNQLSDEYSLTQIDAWQRFFSERLKVKELRNEAEIISLKLKHIVENIQLYQNTEASVSLVKDIYLLYKSDSLSLTGINLGYLKKLPLFCKANIGFHSPSSIHFSSSFKPIFDFEKIFGSECGVPFLSELYKFDDEPKLIQFFEHLGVTQTFDQNRHNSICQNIPTSDGQMKNATQLFKYDLKKYVGLSNVAFEDLSKFTHNGKTLEDWFGFKSKLEVNTILNYIVTNEPNRRELKDLIIELLKVYNPSSDRNLINVFISEGKLLSSAKSYNFVKELHSIDESIRSGIRENEHIIDSLFNKQEQDYRKKYLTLFGIRTLGIEDFNPHFEGEHIDYDFSNQVNKRLVFLAFDSDDEKYKEIENEFKEKFREWKIKKCSKISMKYPAIDSKIIKEDNRNFILSNEKTIYYIGNWVEQRNYLLVHWLKDNILNITKQLQFVQDILLNNPSDIISDFENKGRAVPDEIKRRFIILQQPDTDTHNQIIDEAPETEVIAVITENEEINVGFETEDSNSNPETEEIPKEQLENPFKDITSEDETFIRGIIKGDFELNEKLDANTTAKIKTLMAIRDKYNAAEISDEGRFLKASSDEIIVRSAQNGILYLDVYHWGRLGDSNVSLSIYTRSQIEIFKSQDELINFTTPQNKFGIVRMPNEYSLSDYNSLDNISDKGKWHYVFIVNENTIAAKNYKEVMNLDDYNF
jgi:hypothetical protein